MFTYRYEAKGIQGWILGTDRLKELAGGSAIVDKLAATAATRAKACNGTVVYAAAGKAMLTFTNLADLQAFAGDWPMIVARTAPGLQVVQAWVEGEDPQVLAALLGIARNRILVDLPEAGPWTARAPRTGLPAAARRDKELLDAAALQRSLEGKAGPTEAERALAQTRRDEDPDWSFTNDITDAAWGDGPIAVVHADGNGIGQVVMSKTSDQLRAFAHALDAATNAAAGDAIRRLAHDVQNERQVELPARPVLIGGDDLTFVIAARHALAFTRNYLEAFAERTKSIGSLTACAGIAVVHAQFPFAAALEIASSCCTAAKKELREYGRGGLVFERVTTSTTDASARSRAYAHGERVSHIPHLDDLTQLHGDLRRLPRGPMRQWLALIEARDADAANRLWQRRHEVHGSDPEERQTWERVHKHRENDRAIADAIAANHLMGAR